MFARHAAIGLIVASLAASAVATDKPALQRPTLSHFLVYRETGANGPILVTVLDRVPPSDVRSRFPMLLVVEWSYAGRSDGLPTDDEAPLLYEMDGAIEAMLGRSGRWAMTRTGNGVRRCYFYAAGPRADLLGGVEQVIRSAAARMAIGFKVGMNVWEQPDWNAIRQALASVPEAPAR